MEELWTPNRKVYAPAPLCKRCGGFNREWMNKHRRHAGYGFHRFCCCFGGYKLTECQADGTPEIRYTDSDLSTYLGKTIYIVDSGKCWAVTNCPTNCTPLESVTVDSSSTDNCCEDICPEVGSQIGITFSGIDSSRCTGCLRCTSGGARVQLNEVNADGTYSVPLISTTSDICTFQGVFTGSFSKQYVDADVNGSCTYLGPNSCEDPVMEIESIEVRVQVIWNKNTKEISDVELNSNKITCDGDSSPAVACTRNIFFRYDNSTAGGPYILGDTISDNESVCLSGSDASSFTSDGSATAVAFRL